MFTEDILCKKGGFVILDPRQISEYVDSVYPQVFTNNEIPSAVLKGQVIHESSGNTTVFVEDRNGGSYGLMQVDGDVVLRLGLDPNTNLEDPTSNLYAGFTYMRSFFYGEQGNSNILNLSDYTLKIAMTLLCYNCGTSNFNELYANHLASKLSENWDVAINDSNLVVNWSTCLGYPCYVFINAHNYYELPIDSIQPASELNYPASSFKYGVPFLSLVNANG